MTTNVITGVMGLSLGTAAVWQAGTKIIPVGVVCWETDTNKAKIADGVNLYSQLPYFINTAAALAAGTAANNLLQIGSDGKLPVIDGSKLTGIASAFNLNIITTPTTTAAKNNFYVIKVANALTLPQAPSPGDAIEYANRSGLTTNTILRNGSLIEGLAEDMTVNGLLDSFKLTYIDATLGWIMR